MNLPCQPGPPVHVSLRTKLPCLMCYVWYTRTKESERSFIVVTHSAKQGWGICSAGWKRISIQNHTLDQMVRPPLSTIGTSIYYSRLKWVTVYSLDCSQILRYFCLKLTLLHRLPLLPFSFITKLLLMSRAPEPQCVGSKAAWTHRTRSSLDGQNPSNDRKHGITLWRLRIATYL